jgi:hypothetical protein
MKTQFILIVPSWCRVALFRCTDVVTVTLVFWVLAAQPSARLHAHGMLPSYPSCSTTPFAFEAPFNCVPKNQVKFLCSYQP